MLVKPKNLVIQENEFDKETQELEKGFKIRVKTSLGGKYDKQGWQCVEGTLSKGDTYAISAAAINETMMRVRRPHREVSKVDFKLSLPKDVLL